MRKQHFYLIKIPPCTHTHTQLHFSRVDRWISGQLLALWRAALLAQLVTQSHWAVEGLLPSQGEALGWAGPRDTPCIQRPSVIAQLPHVLGHHIEEESNKALGTDTGHWRQKGMSETNRQK